MTLVDTSVWIDFFRQSSPNIDKTMSELLENGDVIAISAIFGELLQGARNLEEEETILAFWNDLPKMQEQSLFINAGKLSRELKLIPKGIGLIDSYILAATQKFNLHLWTLDKKMMEAYSGLLK